MTTKTPQNAITVQVPEGFNLRVEFMGAGGQLLINGQTYSVNENGLVLPANDQQMPSLGQRALKVGDRLQVGDRLRDGTVVLSVNLRKNKALFVPEKIFGGRTRFYSQDTVVESVNKEGLHGHKDWRRITDDEGERLSQNWNKVATAELQGRPTYIQRFWLASSDYDSGGRTRMGGDEDWIGNYQDVQNLVPVVRSGPARSLDI